MVIGEEPMAYAAQREVVGQRPMTNVTHGVSVGSHRAGPGAAGAPGAHGVGCLSPGMRYLSGRTTPRIRIEPAPAIVTFRPGRGACTIAPSPMYMPTWLASSW